MNTMATDPISSAPTNPSPQFQASGQEQEVVLKIPKDILIQLSELSGLLGINAEDALRYAIESTMYLYRRQEEGAEVVLDVGRKRFKVEWLSPKEFAASSSGRK